MNSKEKILLITLFVIGVVLLQPVSAAETYSTSFSLSPTSPTSFISGSASPTSGLVPLTVRFTDTSRYSLSSWDWDFGDGSPHSYVKNPTHVYTNTGSFQVTLKQKNSYATPTKIALITVTNPPSPPVANFNTNPTKGCVPLSVCFVDQSTCAISWVWDFGDGTSSSLQNPCHIYTSPGNYTVTLTVTCPGGSNSIVKSNLIEATNCQPPSTIHASFSENPTNGCAPLMVCFTDQSTGVITSWSWNFGDGTTSAQQNPCHTYVASGQYWVTLTTTGPAGSDTVTKGPIIVSSCQPQDPILINGCPPYTVQFTGTSTGSPVSWLWNFGDGSISNIQNPTHTYVQCGNYTATLTETYADGMISVKTYPVKISCICPGPSPTYNIRTWSQDGEFPVGNVDIWYKKADYIPPNPIVSSPFIWDSDEVYLGKTNYNGVLSGVSLPNEWIVIRSQSPNYNSKGCVPGGWYYTSSSIVNINEIPSNSCPEINVNLNNKHWWIDVTPITPTVTPTPLPTITPTVTTSFPPAPWPSV